MTKRPFLQALPADGRDGSNGPSRTETLVAIIDHCGAAKTLADQVGNRFLAYLLAMTIQEARSNLRPGDEEHALRSIIDGARQS